MMRYLAIALLLLAGGAARADYAVTAGSGTTIFAFTCFTSKVCPSHVPINSSGTEIFTASAPGSAKLTDGTNAVAVKAASTAAAQTDPALVVRNADTGTTADAAATAGSTGTIHAKLRLMTTQLDTLNTTMQGSIPAGSALIGGTSLYLGSTAADGNSGNKSAQTLRTVQATDSVAVPLWGHGTSGASVPSGLTFVGLRAGNVEPTAVTNGQGVAPMGDLHGRSIVLPYSVKELMVRGSSGAVTDTTQTDIIAAGSGSNKTYVTDWECSNSGTATVTVAFNDSAATTVILPAGGGNNKSMHIPLVTAAATAFKMTLSGSPSGNARCSAQAYYGL